jgi:chromosome segregation ATPase
MEPTDLTVTILREIRDEIRETNRRLEETQQHLDQTKDELGRHIVESEIRTATAITSLAGAIQDVKSLLQERLDLRDRVARCELDIEQIKQRLG